ncbi:hypothetical protein BJF93_00970 [Xaviernesmea oryzae]|uniref:Uncharacterized protein n=1 Tax=Xaviernesmea oryzae TaxID=464029 RepID=A0A1Q9B3T2_9HYPH|nr:hypothetical protein [Xaviernesmea oryzae]OLP62708.1 hypothetical protein BJF93_00970 [Xaviernesmea oryzae]
MGKKPIRDKVVHVRFSAEEWLALQAFADEADLTVSAVLRQLSRHAAGLTPPLGHDAHPMLEIHISELLEIGATLSDIAAALEEREIPRLDRLVDGIGRLAQLIKDQRILLRELCDEARVRAREAVSGNV